MVEPVVTQYGHVYDKEFISIWFKDHSTDPLTNVEFSNKSLFHAYDRRNSIEEFLTKIAIS
jgi:hypothetical protein